MARHHAAKTPGLDLPGPDAGHVGSIFWPVRHYDFVNYDDSDYVTANKHVLAGLKWDTLSWALSTGHASNWHPLTWLSHVLDCQLFGPGRGLRTW